MSRVLVTGSADGLGRLSAARLVREGHEGWVATRMGGVGAPDDLDLGADTQAWLAVSDDPAAKVSGRYFHHRTERPADPAASAPTSRTACSRPARS